MLADMVKHRLPVRSQPLSVPSGTSVEDALRLVLQLPSVGSKRFLTTKVDRHVTGACLCLALCALLSCSAWCLRVFLPPRWTMM